MIGQVYTSIVDFFDSQTQTTRRKVRPVLLVSGPFENDYIALPISTISRPQNRNPVFDLPIPAQALTVLHLSKPCYIRTHKQLTVHKASLHQPLGDMRQDLPDLYLEALAQMETFQELLLRSAF